MAEKNGLLSGLARLRKGAGLRFSIKESPDDFVVEEIPRLPKFIAEGEHCYFKLSKRALATQEALGILAGAIGVLEGRFSCAGQKDRQAKTVQYASVFGVKREALEKARLPPSISVEFAGYANEKLAIGQVGGNRFRIRAGKLAGKGAKEKVEKIFGDIDGVFPNYFGEQRFGSRSNTHEVGRLLLQGKTQDAAEIYLTGISDGENEEKVEARKRLAADFDYSSALSYFPRSLSYERMMLEALAAQPTNFVRAFLRLPRPILLLFVHAYQSYLFNLHLSSRVKEKTIWENDALAGEKVFGSGGALEFPSEESQEGKRWLALKLLGTESQLNDFERELLENEEVRLQDFRVRQMPMLGTRGGCRSALSPVAEFSFDGEWFSFALPSGSYATMALREFSE